MCNTYIRTMFNVLKNQLIIYSVPEQFQLMIKRDAITLCKVTKKEDNKYSLKYHLYVAVLLY